MIRAAGRAARTPNRCATRRLSGDDHRAGFTDHLRLADRVVALAAVSCHRLLAVGFASSGKRARANVRPYVYR